MIKTSVKSGWHSERGIALFIAIFTVLLVTAVATGLLLLTNANTNISGNFRDEQTAFFAAKAGMEEARDRMRGIAANGPLAGNIAPLVPLTAAGPGAPGALYILNPTGNEPVTPWVTNGNAYADTEICDEYTRMANKACAGSPPQPPGGPYYTTTTANAAYASNPTSYWKWVRVTVKTNKGASGTLGTTVSTVDGNNLDNNELVCWNGQNEVTTTQPNCQALGSSFRPVYELTSLAVTPSGAHRWVQSDAATGALPNIPGPMVFDGSNPVYNPPNSSVFKVNGDDNSGGAVDPTTTGYPTTTACPAPNNAFAVGGFNSTSTQTLTTDITGNNGNTTKTSANYLGAGGTPPSVGDVSGQIGQIDTVGQLEEMVNDVTQAASAANIYTAANTSSLNDAGDPGCSTCNPPKQPRPVINVVKGNLSLGGNFSGAGILVVEGNLTIQGGINYDGLILVVGTGTITQSGGGNGYIEGSVLMANLYNSSGQPLSPTSAPGAPSFSWSGGGKMTFQYDSCWQSLLGNSLPFKIVGMRELMY
ncbi:MAG TPA: hypothetical protein VFO39_13975 [Candidatus Sulfotelmatobacter sp.]|nr:hypothetical protein [Candidatus Sulfotelmatobacter sp.]